MKKVFILFFLFSTFIYNYSFGFVKESPEFIFLKNINNMRADFTQKQYDGKNITRSYGKIVVKKPSSILLEHDSNEMRLKIVSINGNIKMIDKDLGQTTYIDNQYTELMQFFTNNLDSDKLTINAKKELCLQFKHLEAPFEACLKVDVEKKTIKYIDVFLVVDQTEIKNAIEKTKISKRYQIMNITFRNIKINQGVDNKEFFIKDNRIFNDED